MHSDNVGQQFTHLFHGTTREITSGVVEPRVRKLAFASPQLYSAAAYAKPSSLNVGLGKVYEVTPVDPNEGKILEPVPVKGWDGQLEVASTKGFKIIREVGHWTPNGKYFHKKPHAECNSKLCK